MAELNDQSVTERRPNLQLKTHDLFFIKGLAHSGNFEVNLETENNDIAFHFNPRFNERLVVRNTKTGSDWGTEERDGGFPFQEDQPFEIVIVVNEAHYKVAVNGARYTDYNHRISKEAIRQLVVKGNVQQLAIRYQEANPYGYVPKRALPSDLIFNPALPYSGPISGGRFAPGRMIRITGVDNGNSLTKVILESKGAGRSIDVLINPGSNPSDAKRTPYDGWGIKERHGPNFSFSPKFDIIILPKGCRFKVVVNGVEIQSATRIPWARIDHLNVSGDAQIFMILVQ